MLYRLKKLINYDQQDAHGYYELHCNHLKNMDYDLKSQVIGGNARSIFVPLF